MRRSMILLRTVRRVLVLEFLGLWEGNGDMQQRDFSVYVL